LITYGIYRLQLIYINMASYMLVSDIFFVAINYSIKSDFVYCTLLCLRSITSVRNFNFAGPANNYTLFKQKSIAYSTNAL